ncbi:unnamed protein product [Effrenium voratum]|nr:unnamed protein product [Effrenium voratum]
MRCLAILTTFIVADALRDEMHAQPGALHTTSKQRCCAILRNERKTEHVCRSQNQKCNGFNSRSDDVKFTYQEVDPEECEMIGVGGCTSKPPHLTELRKNTVAEEEVDDDEEEE